MSLKRLLIVFVLFTIGLSACQPAATEREAETVPTAVALEIDAEPTETQPSAPEPTEAAATATAVAETATPEPAEEPTPEEALATSNQAFVEELLIQGAEGLEIQGTLTVPEGVGPHPGVILLHMLGGTHLIWERNGVATYLQEQGIASLAVDLRGHGLTGGRQDWELAEEDLLLVIDSFTEREEIADEIAFIGASIGANMSLISGANSEAVWGTVLLSPGLDYRGVTTDNRLAAYGERPLLIVASEGDAYAAESSQTLHDTALGESELIIYEGDAHGTNMFPAKPELNDTIVQWLFKYIEN